MIRARSGSRAAGNAGAPATNWWIHGGDGDASRADMGEDDGMDLIGARRLAAVWGIPAAFLFVIVAPPLVLIGRLPDPIAVHWGAGGAPNGSMPFWTSLAFLGGFWLVAWIGLLAAGRAGAPSSPALAVVYFLGGILAAVQISIVDRNLNAEDWTQAGDLAWWGVALVIGAAVAAGAGGWFLGTGAGFMRSATEPGTVPSAGLEAGEPGTWFGTAAVHWPVLLAVAGLGAIPFLPAWYRWIPAVAALLVGVLTAVRVTVDDRGLVAGFGWFGWPRRTVRLEEISRAEVVDVRPIAYGGWGYRIRPGVTALIVRGGTAIRVVRADKRDLVVTVDDAERGAGVLNDLLARAGRPVERPD